MHEQLTVGSLFSGIGGFDLGFERAGMRTVWFCEQDPFCQRVIAKHWPGVPVYPDVRALVADTERSRGDGLHEWIEARYVEADAALGGEDGPNGIAAADPGGKRETRPLPVPVPYVDVLCGGFPCQDLSYAGQGAGIDGERSGLWAEYARLIRELQPRYVVVENVAALLARGMGRVVGDLAACGYDAEWDCIPASAVGAPHRRDRVWLVAYPARDLSAGSAPAGAERQRTGQSGQRNGTLMGDADAERWDGRARELRPRGRGEPTDTGWWESEPDVGRVAHGVPARVDRLRSLGNALVPQIAEWIGHRIVSHERRP